MILPHFQSESALLGQGVLISLLNLLQVGGIDKFLDVSINEAGPLLKMEPVDYEEDAVGYDDYYDDEDDDQTNQDYTGSDHLA